MDVPFFIEIGFVLNMSMIAGYSAMLIEFYIAIVPALPLGKVVCEVSFGRRGEGTVLCKSEGLTRGISDGSRCHIMPYWP